MPHIYKPKSELVTRKEASLMLGVCKTTFDKMVREGRITKLSIEGTRSVRFRRKDVRRLIRSR